MYTLKKLKTLSLLLILFLTVCSSAVFANTTIKIGASAVPHAEILEFIKPLLSKKGIDLKIIVFQDYSLANRALYAKDIDANYFQHQPYLDKQNNEYKYNIVSAGKVHIEPIAMYSPKYKSLQDIPNNATVIMSNSVSDRGRNLLLLQSSGLIKLNNKKLTTDLDFNDIIENKKNLKIKNNVDPAFLISLYKNKEADLLIINTNYALQANLNPKKDGLFVEKSSSPYANIIAVNQEDLNKPEIKTLMRILYSKSTRDFIKNKYNGAVIATRNNNKTVSKKKNN